MAIIYEKTPDGQLVVKDTQTMESKFRLKDLRAKKQFLKAKLDEIQLLIDEAVKLGANE